MNAAGDVRPSSIRGSVTGLDLYVDKNFTQTATKQLYALYTQRLNEETQRQQTLYPIRVHYSR